MEVTFNHSGNLGDVIYSLPAIKYYCESKNVKATLFIHLNQPSNFTAEQHPLGNVMMNQKMFDMAYPLLSSLPYIKNVIAYDKESIPKIDFDLDLFRKECVNLSAGNISQWLCIPHPELRPNLFEPSIILPKTNENYIIVNRSARYQNLFVDYSILEDYENIYFVGVESEFKALSAHNKNIAHLVVNDFLELAKWIAGSKLFIGNQSMAFAIAEQLKVRRILEQYVYAPNVIPQGGEYYITNNNEQFKKSVYICLNGKDSDSNQTEIPTTRKTEAINGC